MRDLLYPPAVLAIRAAFAGFGLRIDLDGLENLPPDGGVVLASNHVSYLDFLFVGLGAERRGRHVRFMAKESVFRHSVAGPLMRGMHHIPVDREAGSDSFRQAMRMLKAGECVGVFPEATISRSFQLKEFKAGAVRMAAAAGVPLVPVVVWGGQRIYTKGRRPRPRWGVAISVRYGEPIRVPRRAAADVDAHLVEVMGRMLDQVQRDYPQRPAGEDDLWWLPAAMGGTAPTPEEAAALDAG